MRSLQLRYKAKGFPVEGFGQTVMMSNQDIMFAPNNGLILLKFSPKRGG